MRGFKIGDGYAGNSADIVGRRAVHVLSCSTFFMIFEYPTPCCRQLSVFIVTGNQFRCGYSLLTRLLVIFELGCDLLDSMLVRRGGKVSLSGL